MLLLLKLLEPNYKLYSKSSCSSDDDLVEEVVTIEREKKGYNKISWISALKLDKLQQPVVAINEHLLETQKKRDLFNSNFCFLYNAD